MEFETTDLEKLPLPEVDPAMAKSERHFSAAKMVTIRMSEDLHDRLLDEAIRVGLSMNQLCKVKLAAAISGCQVPKHWIRRRRKQGLRPETTGSN